MRQKSDAELDEVVQFLASGPRRRGRRSPLYRWLNARADAFQMMLLEMQPTWQAVAGALAAQGLVDGTGKPPTAERVRQTWFKVRQSMPPPKLEPQARAPCPAAAEPAPGPTIAAAVQPVPADLRARLREKFKPVTINRN
jgi:hypothetical protein